MSRQEIEHIFENGIDRINNKEYINDMALVSKADMAKERSNEGLKMESGSLYRCSIDSPLGMITMASDGKALKELWMDQQSYKLKHRSNEYVTKEDLDIFVQTKGWISRYFAGDDPGRLPPLVPEGSEFQIQVWETLQKIPYGETCTYGEVARLIAAVRGGKRWQRRQSAGLWEEIRSRS